VSLELIEADEIVRPVGADGVNAENDLVVRAARILKKYASYPYGVKIHLEKNIPMGAGLGGGSSDAASVLIGLNHLWGLGLRQSELAHLGLQLGADIPFFLFGQNAFVEGIGEQLKRLDLPEEQFLVIFPGQSVATKDVFRDDTLTRNHAPITIADFLASSWKDPKFGNDLQHGIDFFGIDLCAQNLILPEASESVSLIYCSHTLEHLEYKSAIQFMKECLRILKVGGVMRFALPNTSNDFRLLKSVYFQPQVTNELKMDFLTDVINNILPDAFVNLTKKEVEVLIRDTNFSPDAFYQAAIDLGVNVNFSESSPERHISFWSYENLLSVALDIGFKFGYPCYQGSSIAKPFTNTNVFDTTEPHISFYVEIIK
jgi:SAM-dependent methyltransferase